VNIKNKTFLRKGLEMTRYLIRRRSRIQRTIEIGLTTIRIRIWIHSLGGNYKMIKTEMVVIVWMMKRMQNKRQQRRRRREICC
jgi:hypothetical protein